MNPRIIIAELSDQDFDKSAYPADVTGFRIRKTSRGILIHDEKIALINIAKKNYHKLPGGGIEGNETARQGFIREIKEETGADCEILDEAGITLEYRAQFKLLQISYVFFAKVVGIPGEVKFEQAELDEGAELKWTPLSEIEKNFNADNPTENYEDKFIHKRDREILAHYKDKLLTN